ncbi:MAG TPA: thioredoxin domain-containing protein [Patescibacteria group bacterium]|nr:thioredoxin domain-containing protein [Patescibacteria group bacterium]
MKDFWSQNKIFIIVTVATLALLVGGVFLFSRGGSTTSTTGNKVNSEILEPADSFKTSGIVNGKYQPGLASTNATIVEFGDYQCPACGVYHPLIKQLLTEFGGKINFVFRNFPLSQHANANTSSYAVEAAGAQGKYWEMHDKIYEAQAEWSASTDSKSIFVGYAKSFGLNIDQFNKDIDSSKVKDKVKKDTADGNLIGINSTPTFYLNGFKLVSPGSYEELKKVVSDALKNVEVSQTPAPEVYHAHFDLKVYLNGKAIDFALPQYQESSTNPLDPNMHFHDGNGKVVHMHKAGITLKQLFDSFKLTIPNNTVAYVNGKKVENITNYAPLDLDRILIGSTNLTTVSDESCIYSLKCPTRGTPPPEECVGGIGTGCTE